MDKNRGDDRRQAVAPPVGQVEPEGEASGPRLVYPSPRHATAPGWQSRLLNRLLPLFPYKRRLVSAAALHARLREIASSLPDGAPVGLGSDVEATRQHDQGWPTYIVAPAAALSAAHHVVFLHGGGYFEEIARPHWRFVGRLAREVPARCVVPIFPRVPHTCAHELVPAMGRFIGGFIGKVGPECVTIVGNSSGAGLGLAAAQWLRDHGLPQPRALVLVSPWLDVAINGADQAEIALRDPLQAIPGLIEAGRLYAGTLDITHPYVSPLNGDLRGLAPMTVFTGTRDLLHPNSHRLARAAQRDGVDVALHCAQDLPHNYALLPTPEGAEAREIIVRVVRQAAK